MPEEYEAMRDSLVKRGMPLKEAKKRAAMTWNKRHPDNPNPWTKEPGWKPWNKKSSK